MAFNEYTLGKGRLYIDRLVGGSLTGWRYLGNTPSLNVSKEAQTLDHFDSDSGIRVKDKSVTLQEDMSLTFETDNVNPDNLALWFGGTKSSATIAAVAAGVDQFTTVVKGMSYSLGETTGRPEGHQNVTNVVVKIATVTVPQEGNYILDAIGGLITVLPDATDIDAGDTLDVTYTAPSYSEAKVVDQTTTVEGRMMFVQDNPIGRNHSHYWGSVKVTPNGEFALKGEEWQRLSFSVEVLKENTDADRYVIRTVG